MHRSTIFCLGALAGSVYASIVCTVTFYGFWMPW